MENRLKVLETEVEALRAELRLIKRTLRNVGPYRIRQTIEEVVSEMLDNRSWKMISTHDPGYPDTFKSRHKRARAEESELEILPDELNQSENEDDEFGTDPLHVSGSLFSSLSDDDDEEESLNQDQGNTSKGATPAFPGKPSSKMLKGVEMKKQKRTFTRTSMELKLKACRRAMELGSTVAAGRELNVPESSIRSWKTKLISWGHQFENMKQPPEETNSNSHADQQHPKTEKDESEKSLIQANEFAGMDSSITPADPLGGGASEHSSTSNPTNEMKPRDSPFVHGRLRNTAWESFTLGTPREGSRRAPMICNFCSARVSAEAPRLKKHLERCPKLQLAQLTQFKGFEGVTE